MLRKTNAVNNKGKKNTRTSTHFAMYSFSWIIKKRLKYMIHVAVSMTFFFLVPDNKLMRRKP